MLEKLSLIFNIFLTLEDEACVYEHLFLLLELPIGLLSLFWNNFDLFRILLGLGGKEGGTSKISA